MISLSKVLSGIIPFTPNPSRCSRGRHLCAWTCRFLDPPARRCALLCRTIRYSRYAEWLCPEWSTRELLVCSCPVPFLAPFFASAMLFCFLSCQLTQASFIRRTAARAVFTDFFHSVFSSSRRHSGSFQPVHETERQELSCFHVLQRDLPQLREEVLSVFHLLPCVGLLVEFLFHGVPPFVSLVYNQINITANGCQPFSIYIFLVDNQTCVVHY